MGLGCGLDPGLRATSALARFGCGFLGLVVQGVGFIGAGLIISAIGATHVFVHEDLQFLGASAAALAAAAANLVPLVARTIAPRWAGCCSPTAW